MQNSLMNMASDKDIFYNILKRELDNFLSKTPLF